MKKIEEVIRAFNLDYHKYSGQNIPEELKDNLIDNVYIVLIKDKTDMVKYMSLMQTLHNKHFNSILKNVFITFKIVGGFDTGNLSRVSPNIMKLMIDAPDSVTSFVNEVVHEFMKGDSINEKSVIQLLVALGAIKLKELMQLVEGDD